MGQSVFVAVGQMGTRLSSNDGRTWGPVVRGKEGEVYRAVAIGHGKVVSVGTFGGQEMVATSTDGHAWKEAKLGDGGWSNYLRGLCFLNGKFLALGGDPGSVGQANPYLKMSTDGETWTQHALPGKFMLRRMAYGNGVYVGVGDRGRRAFSKDALEWNDVPDTKPAETLIDVAFGHGVFVGVGLHGLRLTSVDGAKWSEKLLGEEGEHLNSVVWADDRFVAVGAGATYVSPDGQEWQRHSNELAPVTVAHGQKVFVGPRWRGRLMLSPDGIAWTEVARADVPLEAVACGDLG